MHKELPLKTAPRDFALQNYMNVLSQARKIGVQNKSYVLNALRIMSNFYYDTALVKNTANSVLLRLEKEHARQLINDNPFHLPEKEGLNGNFLIGNVAGTNTPVSLSRRNINENIGLWGRAGGGKTNLCQSLCLQLAQAGIPVRVYDYKAEYRDLLPYIERAIVLNPQNDKFNPLQAIGNSKEWIQFLADTLQQDFNLKPETKFMWINYTDELYQRYDIYDKGRVYPSLKNMKDFLLEEANKKTTPAANKKKIYTCLELLNSLLTSIGNMLDCNSGYTEEALSDFSFVSYEMSNLSSNIQSWLSKIRLKHLYHKCLAGKERNTLKTVAIFEEAKMLFAESLHKGSTSIDYIKQLITQARFSGFGAILTDQNKNELADFVQNNLSCQICFNLASPKEMRAMGYSLGCNEEQIRKIRYLKIPYAIVAFSGSPPFMVEIPKAPVEGPVTDEEFERLMQPKLAQLNRTLETNHLPAQRSGLITKTEIETGSQTQPLNSVEPEKSKSETSRNPLKDLEDFLRHIQNNPGRKISDLYQTLNYSGRKGNNLKEKAKANNLIEETICKTGRKGRSTMELQLTETGKEYIREK